MKPFIIHGLTSLIEQLESQQQHLLNEIELQVLIPHQQILRVYEEDVSRLYKKSDDERADAQFREAHATEERVIRSLLKQMIHIVAAEITTRAPSRVLCEYKNNLFIIPIRYK
jgi:outer membrane lipopolysaccharide assembly protein LptE/RlpB